MEIKNIKETLRYDTNYDVARNRISEYVCVRIFKTDITLKIIKKLKIAFPNYFIWDNGIYTFEFANLDNIVYIFKYKNSYLLNFKRNKELLVSQFIVNSNVYNDLIKTLEERNRFDILLNLGI